MHQIFVRLNLVVTPIFHSYSMINTLIICGPQIRQANFIHLLFVFPCVVCVCFFSHSMPHKNQFILKLIDTLEVCWFHRQTNQCKEPTTAEWKVKKISQNSFTTCFSSIYIFFSRLLNNWVNIVYICHTNTPGSYLFFFWKWIWYTQRKINRFIQYCCGGQLMSKARRLNKQYGHFFFSRVERSKCNRLNVKYTNDL